MCDCVDTSIETFLHIDIWYVREKEIDCLPKTKHNGRTIQQQLKSIILHEGVFLEKHCLFMRIEKEKTKCASCKIKST